MLGRGKKKIQTRKMISWDPLTAKIVVIQIQCTPKQPISLTLNLYYPPIYNKTQKHSDILHAVLISPSIL